MATDGRPGASALDRLRERFDADDATCPECGYEDEGGWRAATTGDRVVYRHLCPSCGAQRTRTLRLRD
jgi:predicted RNA-binding Zn-ribbon protein involved in translation (DUF1610 family)